MKKVILTLSILIFCVSVYSQSKNDSNTEKISSGFTIYKSNKNETEIDFIKRVNKSLAEYSKEGWYAVQFDRSSTKTGANGKDQLIFYVLLNKKYNLNTNKSNQKIYLHSE